MSQLDLQKRERLNIDIVLCRQHPPLNTSHLLGCLMNQAALELSATWLPLLAVLSLGQLLTPSLITLAGILKPKTIL